MIGLVQKHDFNLSPDEHGGEGLRLVTEVFDNGDGEYFLAHHLTLHSYGNMATFHLHSIRLTSEILLNLSNKLREIERKFNV